jgi:ribonuclease J
MIMKRNNPPGISRQGASTAVREKPQTATASQKTDSKDVLKVIPLGGIEEVGENMTIMEYGDDILVIDMGLGFPDETMPGIDYIIPNTKYLEENKKRIKGVIITHGHLDHIGAIPYILPKIGDPPIYTMKLSGELIKSAWKNSIFWDDPKFMNSIKMMF